MCDMIPPPFPSFVLLSLLLPLQQCYVSFLIRPPFLSCNLPHPSHYPQGAWEGPSSWPAASAAWHSAAATEAREGKLIPSRAAFSWAC
eukprot:5594035-Pyramimonas_sp.AAC.1